MRIEFLGRGFQANDELKRLTTGKLEKAVRFLEEPIEARVTFELERHLHRVDLHVMHRFGTVQAQEEASDMRDAIAQASTKLDQQAKRARKRFTDRRRRAARTEQNANHWPVDVVEKGSMRAGEAPRVIKSSLLRIKPMSIEEAAMHLESSEHGFVVFRDAANDRVSVLFRRKDENYGLIAPEF